MNQEHSTQVRTETPLSAEWLEELRDLEETHDPSVRARIAEARVAEIDPRIEECRQEQGRLGSPSEIADIRRSSRLNLIPTYVVGKNVCIGVDGGVWTYWIATLFMMGWWAVLIFPLLSILAWLMSHIGTLISREKLTDPASVPRTERLHVGAMRRLAGVIGVGLLLFVVAGLLPSEWTWLVLTLGALPFATLTLCLPALAGVLRSLANYLSKSRRYDELTYEIEQLLAFKRRLGPFMTVERDGEDSTDTSGAPAAPVIPTPGSRGDGGGLRIAHRKLIHVLLIGAVLMGAGVPARAGTRCGVFVDESDSLDRPDRQVGVEFFVETGTEYVAEMGCADALVAGSFSSETRFARRSWIPIVPELADPRCEDREPEPLAGHRWIYGKLRNVYEKRKAEVVAECTENIEPRDGKAARGRFRDGLRRALTVEPKTTYTRIVEFLEGLLATGEYRSIVLITDGIENPPRDLQDLVVPEGTVVTLILVAPRVRPLDDVLAAGEAWAAVSGVTVVTTGELDPGLWQRIRGR